MLAQVLIGPNFRPEIVVILICSDLSVHEVTNTGQEDNKNKFLHSAKIHVYIGSRSRGFIIRILTHFDLLLIV